jgi:hypothetical protein
MRFGHCCNKFQTRDACGHSAPSILAKTPPVASRPLFKGLPPRLKSSAAGEIALRLEKSKSIPVGAIPAKRFFDQP